MTSSWWATPASIQQNLTGNSQNVQLEIDGAPSVMVQVTGTWQLDLVVQGSMDGSNWSNPLMMWELDAFPSFRGHIQLGMNSLSGATSRNGQFRVATEGFKFVRVASVAAGGTPGTAAVTITASPTLVAFPTSGYSTLIFDAVLPTASRNSPVFPAPPPGWRWDNSETTDGGTQTSWSGAFAQAILSDNYSMTPNAPQQKVTVGPIGVSSYLSGENNINARQTYLGNWVQFTLGATAFSTGTARISIWVQWIPPAVSPFAFSPGSADQTTLVTNGVMPDIGSLSSGVMPWMGAFLLATDALVGADGGKMRRLRVDSNQSLVVAAALPTSQASGVSRNARNVNATVQTLSSFANTMVAATITNASVADAFVEFFDVSGTVTLGTTTPNLEVIVKAGTTLNVQLSPYGMLFANAIKVASVTADNGTSGSAAGVHVQVLTAA